MYLGSNLSANVVCLVLELWRDFGQKYTATIRHLYTEKWKGEKVIFLQ